MRMASYQETLRRIQPIVPVVFESLQGGLDAARAMHSDRRLDRHVDQHYFAHSVRRVTCDRLRDAGLLVTDPEHERSALAMSGIQIDYNYVRLWVFRGKSEFPLPNSVRKRRFYEQVPTLDGADNVLLLWDDDDGALHDPMHMARPVGGDHHRRNLRLDWEGRLSRRMGGMRAADLDELVPDQQWTQLEGDGGS